MPFNRLIATTAVFSVLASGLAFADALDTPQGPVILTIDGSIGNTNDGSHAVFDHVMLTAIGSQTIATTTIWTEGEQTFTGVPLGALVKAVAGVGSTISATAINDYAVDIPAEDWEDGGPIVAYLNNGEPMSVRDKGPLWIVYPYDSSEDFQTEVIYSRSIWQLDRITVKE